MEKPLIIGISGGSGSGKTSFIRMLKECFTTEEVCVISQDDYYRPREEQRVDDKGITNFDLPESIDKDAFLGDIQKLIRGEDVEKQEYTFNNALAKSRMLTFRPAPILIIEGLFVFYFSQINELMDLRVFLHAKENLKVIRRIKRDKVERNYPLDDVLYRYEHHVLPTFEKYIKPFQEDADLIINNNIHFARAIQVLEGYFRDYLNKMKHP
jgi:uridine kinase